MNRWRIVLIVPAVSVMALYVAPGASAQQSPAGAAVFEMKYRGLDTPDDPLSYRSYWGFGEPDDPNMKQDPFVLAVRSQVKECSIIYNPVLPKARCSVVELKDNKPVAYYFDINADGKLADNEKFPPASLSGSNFGYPYAFVTSDFMMRVENRPEIPFRFLVVGGPMGLDRVSFMSSPSCVLEGQATLAGERLRLVLYSNGFSGSFTQFGLCSIALAPAEQKLSGYLSRSTLSSLIYYQGAFYHLKLQGTHAKDSTVRVVMEKDTTPTGQAALDVAGQEGLKARVTGVRLQGAQDATLQLYLTAAQPTLPVGQYKVSSGSIGYGLRSNDEWGVSFENGPQFDIKAAETTRLSLGQPVLSIKAIEEKDRYADNPKERSTYAQETLIYLSPQIRGKAGEVYLRFTQKTAGNNDPTDVKPHVTIRDSDGKTVAWGDMGYT